jgi:hypothetical protein
MDDLFDCVERVDSPENDRSNGAVMGPEIARRNKPGTGGEPGEGGVDGGVLDLRVIVGVLRVFVGVVRGVALGVTSEDISGMPRTR